MIYLHESHKISFSKIQMFCSVLDYVLGVSRQIMSNIAIHNIHNDNKINKSIIQHSRLTMATLSFVGWGLPLRYHF